MKVINVYVLMAALLLLNFRLLFFNNIEFLKDVELRDASCLTHCRSFFSGLPSSSLKTHSVESPSGSLITGSRCSSVTTRLTG